MSRLTVKDEYGNWCLNGVSYEELYEGHIISQDAAAKIYEALNKLRRYEDTGLEFDDAVNIENPVILKRAWTIWELRTVTFLNPFNGISCAINVQMRENGKKVQVRFDHFKAEASCYKDDKFDVSKGFDLAKRRLVIKLLDNEVKEYAKGF